MAEFKQKRARLTQDFNMPDGPCRMKRSDLKKMKKWQLITNIEYTKAMKKRAKWQIHNNEVESINS